MSFTRIRPSSRLSRPLKATLAAVVEVETELIEVNKGGFGWIKNQFRSINVNKDEHKDQLSNAIINPYYYVKSQWQPELVTHINYSKLFCKCCAFVKVQIN